MKIDEESASAPGLSRRDFLSALGGASAGLLLAPWWGRTILRASLSPGPRAPCPPIVAVTQAQNYERALITEKVQHLFDSLGGISDLLGPGKRVAIKINLTGGSGSASSSRLRGVPITENMWTHPEVLRAVAASVIDCGVRPADVYFVEALWDYASYANFGYAAVQQELGTRMVDLNQPAPYSQFVDLPVGEHRFFYTSFRVNQILRDVDVFISIPKLKQHYEAGLTGALKNQVGMVPKQLYEMPNNRPRREALHTQGAASPTHLPRAICDLNLARKVHLAVIDGIKNAHGGEGVWNPTFAVAEDHVLVAGKEPVATDSVAAFLIGLDPQAHTLALPGGGHCDNHLHLLALRGVGTNQLSAIQVVGDGAGLVTAVKPKEIGTPEPARFVLYPNYPNPFNAATMIGLYLPRPAHTTITVKSCQGRKVTTLFAGDLGTGYPQFHWQPLHLPSGVYFCVVKAGGAVQSIKLLLEK